MLDEYWAMDLGSGFITYPKQLLSFNKLKKAYNYELWITMINPARY